MATPLFLTIGLHAHQPVGNFDHVFEEHLQNVYEPFLNRAREGNLFPLTLHLSGPLLEWLDAHAPKYLDLVGSLAAEGKVEILVAGYYEPILPALLREDRLDQIRWMKEAVRHRFGVESRGLWLTERVWEPDLASDLVDAGVDYVLVDDRHFVAAGFSRNQLHRPFRTESAGKSLGVFAIDEHLRYLIPFHPPEDTAAYLRNLRAEGKRLAVAADDIEKFGGWPGTREWVYEKGWLEDFMRTIHELSASGEVQLATFSQVLAELPSGGPAYLPSSSYREMEEWALPTDAFRRLEELRDALQEKGLSPDEVPLVRGSHWRNFFVKYPESNRMHKKSIVLSRLSRERNGPPEVHRALGAAQCNDVYWHGVFGGLYLKHLRDAVWQRLAEAEGHLRAGECLSWEEKDLDLDGFQEVWTHSPKFSAVVSPRRGGALEELTLFEERVNLANTLTRRREPYHRVPKDKVTPSAELPDAGTDHTTPSIHDLEGKLGFVELPPKDAVDRALFQERILSQDLSLEEYTLAKFEPLHSWAHRPFSLVRIEEGPELDVTRPQGSCPEWIEMTLHHSKPRFLEKRLRFEKDGSVEARFHWDPTEYPDGAVFTTELSLGSEARWAAHPESSVWRFPIRTSSKSEKGFDETTQGESITLRWPASSGWARVRLTRD